MNRTTLHRAFSLAELMIALAVLGIGLLFIAAALPVGISYSRDAVDFAAGSGAADEAFETIELKTRLSRPLFKDPLAPFGNSSPAVYPTRSGQPYYPIRLDNFFRPRQMPRTAVLIVPPAHDPYPRVLEPREGSYEHPYVDPFPGSPTPLRGDTRDDGYEPLIKVRPLNMPNLSATHRGSGPTATRDMVMDDGEELIGHYVASLGLTFLTGTFPQPALEFDPAGFLQNPSGSGISAALVDNPPFSPLLRFFPAVTPVVPFRAERFAPATGVNPETDAATLHVRYWGREVLPPSTPSIDPFGHPTGHSAVEFDKAAERRITWTAFYRRVQYDSVSPSPTTFTYVGPAAPQGTNAPPNVDSYQPGDRQLYEIIVVVTRKPSTRHRFARQLLPASPTPGVFSTFERPTAAPETVAVTVNVRGGDRVAPTPWLVTTYLDPSFPPEQQAGTGSGVNAAYDGLMQGLVRPTFPNPDFNDLLTTPDGLNRPLRPNFPQRATFKFRVRPEVGRLLAPGSIMIPAANDNFPHNRSVAPGVGNFAQPSNRVAGFVPHNPDSLPIYEVLEVLPDDLSIDPDLRGVTVIVKNNGAYPWINGAAPGTAAAFFPFWVIPPSFAERDSGGRPLFERSSPIIGVYRKVIRLPEVQ